LDQGPIRVIPVKLLASSYMGKWLGATIVVVVVALCVACAQPPIRPMPGIEDKIDRDARIEGTAPSHVL
jgi:hypothetical protein